MTIIKLQRIAIKIKDAKIMNNNDERYPIFDEQARAAHMAEIKKRRAEQRKRDRQQALAFLIIFTLVVTSSIIYFVNSGSDKDDSKDTAKVQQQSIGESENDNINKSRNSDSLNLEPASHETEVIDGITYIDGIMIANKTYSLPSTYAPGLDPEAEKAFNEMAQAASNDGLFLYICSAYRSYADQEFQYNQFAQERGTAEADEVSARPGHSEHQTGLAIDVNSTEFSFGDTAEAKWLAEHCTEFGFIIRFPKDKEECTGFEYEPWHIRYLGIETAKKVNDSGLCLEEYLGVTSEYQN